MNNDPQISESCTHKCSDDAVRVARHVTWVGFWCNATLGTAKIIAGVLGRSGAVIADGVHSFSDFITDVIVLVMVTIGRRKANRHYEYGHGKYETFATMLISVALVIVGVVIFREGLDKILQSLSGKDIPRPGWIALAVCAVSIAVKEWLYHYTRRAGERIHSGAVIANAWHHRSDSLSSIATLLGVGAAMLLGDKARICDPIAEMIVAIFIVIVGIRMSIPAVRELLEVALPEEMQNEIRDVITSVDGVYTYHHMRTRRNGSTIIVDIHIKVDPHIQVVDAHHIATGVENGIMDKFGSNTIVTTHIEPYNGEEIYPDGSCKD